jgi:hypothetical protein
MQIDTQTTRQKEAREQNWKIFSIRGVYAAIIKLDIPPVLKTKICELIDEVLQYYGALPELEHRRIILKDDTYTIDLD